MAAEGLVGEFCHETTCPICLEYFKDPVTVDCGHNFCQACLPQYWRESNTESSCQQCRETVQQRSFRPNQQLAKLVELVKKLREDKRDEGKRGVCERHQEPLKLFCAEHQAPICVVCDKSKEHREHNVFPIEEASQEYKGKIKDCLKTLGKAREKLVDWKAAEELGRQEGLGIRNALVRYGKQLAEYELDLSPKLEEKLRITSLKKSVLQRATENYKESLEQVLNPCKLEQALKAADSLTEAMNKVDVILDVHTAHPHLMVSENMKDVKLESKKKSEWWRKNMLDNPARFDWEPCVLGYEKLFSGVHWWVVEVSGIGSWAVGVATDLVRKGHIRLNPDEGIWAVGKPYRDTYSPFDVLALTSPEPTLLSLSKDLTKILLVLDYEGGRVDFFDADTNALIFTFSTETCGENIRPFFQVREWGFSLKC